MITTVLLAEPCPECKSDEAKINDEKCFEEWMAAGNRSDDFNVVQCEHLSCVRCGLQLS